VSLSQDKMIGKLAMSGLAKRALVKLNILVQFTTVKWLNFHAMQQFTNEVLKGKG